MLVPENDSADADLTEKDVSLYLKLTPLFIKLQEHEVMLLREHQAAEASNKPLKGGALELPFTPADKFILEAALKEWKQEDNEERAAD